MIINQYTQFEFCWLYVEWKITILVFDFFQFFTSQKKYLIASKKRSKYQTIKFLDDKKIEPIIFISLIFSFFQIWNPDSISSFHCSKSYSSSIFTSIPSIFIEHLLFLLKSLFNQIFKLTKNDKNLLRKKYLTQSLEQNEKMKKKIIFYSF
jgi:hypothetical protein